MPQAHLNPNLYASLYTRIASHNIYIKKCSKCWSHKNFCLWMSHDDWPYNPCNILFYHLVLCWVCQRQINSPEMWLYYGYLKLKDSFFILRSWNVIKIHLYWTWHNEVSSLGKSLLHTQCFWKGGMKKGNIGRHACVIKKWIIHCNNRGPPCSTCSSILLNLATAKDPLHSSAFAPKCSWILASLSS